MLIDFTRDMWTYISLGYFRQKPVAGEVGSSTMPHKMNPIDFENSEGNLGLANALLAHFAEKLPVSRLQRDLSDSTVMRNLGVALGHSVLRLSVAGSGTLRKVELDEARLDEDLGRAWEVLAEAVQTVMRAHGIPDAYDRLKAFTRGRPWMRAAMREFIASLDAAARRKRPPARPRARQVPRSCTAFGAATPWQPMRAPFGVRNVTQLARGRGQPVVSHSEVRGPHDTALLPPIEAWIYGG